MLVRMVLSVAVKLGDKLDQIILTRLKQKLNHVKPTKINLGYLNIFFSVGLYLYYD